MHRLTAILSYLVSSGATSHFAWDDQDILFYHSKNISLDIFGYYPLQVLIKNNSD